MSIVRPLVQAQTYRNLLFLAAGIPIAAVVLGLVIAGWTSIAVLAITPLVVPVLLGYRGVVGLLARGDALARAVAARHDAGPPVSSAGRGFWGRAKAVFLDPNFWRQQGYLLLRMTLGFALAVGGALADRGALGWITLPIWYRWTDNNYGSWHVDTLGRALLFVPAGLVALVAAAWLAAALGALSAWQVRSLLARAAGADLARGRSRYRRRALWIDGCTAAGLVVLLRRSSGRPPARLFLAAVGAAPARAAVRDPRRRRAGRADRFGEPPTARARNPRRRGRGASSSSWSRSGR